MAQLDFDAVTKVFAGPVTALDRFTLAVADRELVVLVGTSGAGKTTALRVTAGLERATSGSIRMNGERIDHRRPADRDMAMVFQQSALYPHLTVRNNIAYSLRARHTPRQEVDSRVAAAVVDLGIADLLERFPDTLSGGQAQRVALARSLVRRPNCLLLDEPFAGLDAPLRAELRHEFRQAQKRDPVTTLFVTHDQEEALALADRLVVLRAGAIEQIGTPLQVYEQPANRFVAGFVGSPPMNLVDGTIVEHGGHLRFEVGGEYVPVATAMQARLRPHSGKPMTLGLRPQDLTLTPKSTSSTALEVVVKHREFRGDRWMIRGTTKSGAMLAALVDNPANTAIEGTSRFYVHLDRAHYFTPAENGSNVLLSRLA